MSPQSQRFTILGADQKGRSPRGQERAWAVGRMRTTNRPFHRYGGHFECHCFNGMGVGDEDGGWGWGMGMGVFQWDAYGAKS